MVAYDITKHYVGPVTLGTSLAMRCRSCHALVPGSYGDEGYLFAHLDWHSATSTFNLNLLE